MVRAGLEPRISGSHGKWPNHWATLPHQNWNIYKGIDYYHIINLQEILQDQDSKQLLDESDLNENTPLHIAAMNGHTLIVEVSFLNFCVVLVKTIRKIDVPIVKLLIIGHHVK